MSPYSLSRMARWSRLRVSASKAQGSQQVTPVDSWAPPVVAASQQLVPGGTYVLASREGDDGDTGGFWSEAAVAVAMAVGATN